MFAESNPRHVALRGFWRGDLNQSAIQAVEDDLIKIRLWLAYYSSPMNLILSDIVIMRHEI